MAHCRSAWTFVLFGFLLLFDQSAFAAAVQAVDDSGRPIHLSAPARRILSLAPHVTELIFAAGAGSKLVGVTTFSDYPEAAKKIPLVGDYGKIDAERILAIKPDLVIGWQSGNSPADIASLERLGIPVFLTEPRRLEDIPRLLGAIGELAGTQAPAAVAANEFRTKSDILRQEYAGRPPVRVFYEIWHEPLMTINGDHLISAVIDLCGGRNLFSRAGGLTPTISIEDVLAGNPQAVVASHSLQGWQAYPRLDAVRHGNLFYLHPDLIQRQTPRILEGARQMCAQIDQARRSK